MCDIQIQRLLPSIPSNMQKCAALRCITISEIDHNCDEHLCIITIYQIHKDQAWVNLDLRMYNLQVFKVMELVQLIPVYNFSFINI